MVNYYELKVDDDIKNDIIKISETKFTDLKFIINDEYNIYTGYICNFSLSSILKNNLKKLSKLFTNKIFELYIEENYEKYKIYFYNGKYQEVYPKIIWEEFDVSKLKE